jgi:hypothetical protein
MHLTWSYLDLSEDKKALELATEAVRRWPTSPYAQIQMACVRLLEGNISAATGHAQRIVGVFPRDTFALEILSNGALDEGHFEAAIARYRPGYPELFVSDLPAVDRGNFQAAIDLAAIFLRQDATGRASLLLDGAAANIAKMPRLGNFGHGISDVQVNALRGEKAKALTVLREAQIAGWRGPVWRYYATSIQTSLPFAAHPNSKPSSPISSATWRESAPASLRDPRMRRLSCQHHPLADSRFPGT